MSPTRFLCATVLSTEGRPKVYNKREIGFVGILMFFSKETILTAKTTAVPWCKVAFVSSSRRRREGGGVESNPTARHDQKQTLHPTPR